MHEPPNDLWLAFRDGHKIELGDGERVFTMRSTHAGSLVLPSGRIVASDPLVDPWNEPFKTTVTPGTYLVHLALANDDVAVVMILFADGPPTRWKKAKPAAFSVDAATGCLMDARAAMSLRKKAKAGKYERWCRRFEDSMLENGLWANVPIGSSANAILFHTWGGDGTFPIYFGFGDDDEPICLVIDMLPR